jgi:threonine/homoserine/homoserine lactone efflux protein
VFAVIRLAGAAYLVFLGLGSLHAAWRGSEAVGIGSPATLGHRSAFRQGLVSNLGNPKMAVFFTSLLPQFASPGSGSVGALLTLGLLFCLMTLSWLSAYAVLVARARHVLGRPVIRRVLDAVMGAVCMALGLRVAVTTR